MGAYLSSTVHVSRIELQIASLVSTCLLIGGSEGGGADLHKFVYYSVVVTTRITMLDILLNLKSFKSL